MTRYLTPSFYLRYALWHNEERQIGLMKCYSFEDASEYLERLGIIGKVMSWTIQ